MQRIKSEDEIRRLQRLLRSASRIYRVLPCPEEDGIYSSLTRAAVLIFQQCSRLPATGETDIITMKKLEHAAAAAEELCSPPEAVSPFPSGRTVLSVGSSGSAVHILQIMILYISQIYENVPYPETSGIYGPMTAGAVAAVQRAWGLVPDGRTDIFTWNRITILFGTVTAEPEK